MASLKEIYAARVAEGRLKQDPAQEDALALLEDLRRSLEEVPAPGGLMRFFRAAPPPPRGLYIWGGVGRGKSMLMDLFYEHAPVEARRRVHFHAFMQEVHAKLHAARQTGVEDAIAPVAEGLARDVRLLCLDEMQITDITDAMIVGRLFQKLFDAGVTVVTTSNRPPDDLYKDGLNRDLFLPFIGLLKERMQVHELESPRDHRQHRLQGEARYFTPINANARARIEAIWTGLTGGASSPLVLRVNGREVTVPAYRNGAGRAAFWDLCGQPLGPADYLAIAGALRVLVLEDIPCLGRSNFNQAKRFVTLIDALYEARVTLICSAEAPPHRLYLEGEGSFEFERTASRLAEMQSADWGRPASEAASA
ncbi:cell division protein ZapE [Brevirhabdus pacifica]|uniref:Cell division protein ZapE n=1 Tax=Brevirhabdus pacifica TaxID=1267768 RepID=A0A1U7DJ68_9RHOB|nr:cell division protein ZapE [Brevirhabdus pacifica]APX90026.1 cell division protein ZapE [Brevirhabdus pacifica]OWU75377.1 ATPase [Loktanella sp. 22II-4b]PJJ82731.1 cell division protein ZapE [Brevirhabdus pacifica]